MGIFNLGGIASAYSTSAVSVISKPSIWDKLKGGLSSFEQEYRNYMPQNKPAGQQVTNFASIPIKKNNVLLYVGLGGIALVAIYLIMK